MLNFYFEQLDRIGCLWSENKRQATDANLVQDYTDCVTRVASTNLFKPEHVRIILEHFPKLCRASIRMDERINEDAVEHLVDLLSRHSNLATVIARPENERLLGWFCCTHAELFTRRMFTKDSKLLRTLLRTWTTKDIDDAFIPDMANVVSLLYGPACWELYGDNIPASSPADTILAISRTLYQENLPFVFKRKDMAFSTELPNSMA